MSSFIVSSNTSQPLILRDENETLNFQYYWCHMSMIILGLWWLMWMG